MGVAPAGRSGRGGPGRPHGRTRMPRRMTLDPTADGGYPFDSDLNRMTDEGCPHSPDPARWADPGWPDAAGPAAPGETVSDGATAEAREDRSAWVEGLRARRALLLAEMQSEESGQAVGFWRRDRLR